MVFVVFSTIIFLIILAIYNYLLTENPNKKHKTELKYILFTHLLTMPFIYYTINNDVWFLIAAGRSIQQNGLTTKETLTMHDGFSAIQQQYPISTVLSWLYDVLGNVGLMIFCVIVGYLAIVVFYKLFKRLTNNVLTSLLLTSLAMQCYAFLGFITTRPYLISTSLLILEVYLLESYIQKKSKKYLIGLPIISLLMINIHASTWLMFFVFLLPFIVDMLNIQAVLDKTKKKPKIPYYKYDEYDKKPIFISIILSFFVGVINPYGVQAMTYVFRSYGITEINQYVNEMKPLYVIGKTFPYSLLIFITITLLTIVLATQIKSTKKARNIYFMLGTGLMALMNKRNIIFYIFSVFYLIASMLSKESLEKDYKKTEKTETEKKTEKTQEGTNKEQKTEKNFIEKAVYGLLGVILVSSLVVCTQGFMNKIFMPVPLEKTFTYIKENAKIQEKNNEETVMTLEWIDGKNFENTQNNAVRVYTSYNIGGHAEFFGVKPYIDPRAEIFLKSNNGKEDIFKEYFYLLKDIDNNYESFVQKYDFDYFVTEADKKLDKKLSKDSRYKKVMEEENCVLYKKN